MGSNSERIVLHSLNVVSTLKGVSPIKNFFLMKPEKTPYEILKENHEFLKETLANVKWLKSVYKQDSERQQKQIELYKKGLPSFIDHSYVSFEKAKVFEKTCFLDLQMLN